MDRRGDGVLVGLGVFGCAEDLSGVVRFVRAGPVVSGLVGAACFTGDVLPFRPFVGKEATHLALTVHPLYCH